MKFYLHNGDFDSRIDDKIYINYLKRMSFLLLIYNIRPGLKLIYNCYRNPRHYRNKALALGSKLIKKIKKNKMFILSSIFTILYIELSWQADLQGISSRKLLFNILETTFNQISTNNVINKLKHIEYKQLTEKIIKKIFIIKPLLNMNKNAIKQII